MHDGPRPFPPLKFAAGPSHPTHDSSVWTLFALNGLHSAMAAMYDHFRTCVALVSMQKHPESDVCGVHCQRGSWMTSLWLIGTNGVETVAQHRPLRGSPHLNTCNAPYMLHVDTAVVHDV